MAKTIRVKAGANGPVFLPQPIQGARSIGDEWMEVESTAFIRGRLRAGDLVAEGAEEVASGDEVFTPENTGAQDDVTTSAQQRRTTTRRPLVPGKES